MGDIMRWAKIEETNVLACLGIWTVTVLAAAFGAATLTGIVLTLQGESIACQFCHQFAGRLMISLAWPAIALSACTFVVRGVLRGRMMGGLAGIGLAIFLLLLVLNTSFVGYLGPSRNPGLDPETLLRFQVIHLIFQPALLGLLLTMLWYLHRRLSVLEKGAAQTTIASDEKLADD